eukprot:tig00021536_g22233.t1
MPCGGGGASGGGASIARLSAARRAPRPWRAREAPLRASLWIRFPANAKPSAAGPPGEPRAPGASCGGAVAGIDQAGHKRRAWSVRVQAAVAGIDQAGDKRRAWGTGAVAGIDQAGDKRRARSAPSAGSSSFPPASGDGVAAGVGGQVTSPRGAAGGASGCPPLDSRPAKTGASSVNEALDAHPRPALDDLKFNSTGSFVCLSCALTLLSVSAEGGASPPLFTCPSCGDPHPAASGLVCSSRIDALFSFLAYIDDAAFAASWISGDLCLRTALTEEDGSRAGSPDPRGKELAERWRKALAEAERARAARTTPTSSPRARRGGGEGEGGSTQSRWRPTTLGSSGIDPGLIGRQIDASPEAARPS